MGLHSNILPEPLIHSLFQALYGLLSAPAKAQNSADSKVSLGLSARALRSAF